MASGAAVEPEEVEVLEDTANQEQVIRVSSTSNPQAVASTVAHALYDNRRVVLRSIGASATNQAVKALAIAAGFVASRGLSMVCRPGFANVRGQKHGDEQDLSAIVLIVFTV